MMVGVGKRLQGECSQVYIDKNDDLANFVARLKPQQVRPRRGKIPAELQAHERAEDQ